MLVDKRPVVVCLSETHVTPDFYDSELEFDGYQIYRVDSDSRHTGGTIIYIMKNIKVSNVQKYCLPKCFWLLSLEIIYNNQIFLILSLYRSPNSNFSNFMNVFEYWCEKNICDNNIKVIVCGDFNVDYFSDTADSVNLKNVIIDLGLENIVKEVTHPTDNGGTLIDWAITNYTDILVADVLQSPKISTHFMVSVRLRNSKAKYTKQIIKSRGRNMDYSEISLKLLDVNWNTAEEDVNKKYKSFYNSVINILDEVAPMKTISISSHYKEWWNAAVKFAIEERDKSYRNFVNHKTEQNRNIYKQMRNTAVKVMRTEKRIYYEKKIDNCKHDVQSLWNTLKTLIPKNIVDTNFLDIDFEHETVSKVEDMPNALNSFYIKSIDKIIDGIDRSDSYFPVDFATKEGSFANFTFIDYATLKKLVFSMPNKGSPDGINMILIKNIYESISEPLLNLINSSLKKGKIPDDIKISTIIPVPKVSKVKKASELRPVNMLSCIEKILERAVYEQVINFIEENKLLTSVQSGFRSKHSCETALQCVLDDWRFSLDKKQATVAVFLDLQRAFETVDRMRLMKKLENFGFGGTVLEWFSNFLTNRKQRVKLKDHVSSELQSERGVPQGSVLGPLLFLIYINDISELEHSCIIHLFADDALIYYSSECLVQCVSTINNSLGIIYKWCCVNLLKINIEKTKYMVISNLQQYNHFTRGNFEIMIGTSKICRVNEFKYLGVVIDRELKFKQHVNQLIKKISFKIRYLSRCSRYLTKWTKTIIFNSLILPHFTYCSSILYILGQNERNRFQKLQNRSMRIILSCSKLTPISEMLNNLKWLSVKHSFLYHSLVFIFKIKNGLAPVYLQNKILYNHNIHKYNTRHRDNFHITSVNNTKAQNSVFFRGLKDYNELPENLKSITSLNNFKKALKYYIFSNIQAVIK